MRLSWPMAFGLLVFASVAWGRSKKLKVVKRSAPPKVHGSKEVGVRSTVDVENIVVPKVVLKVAPDEEPIFPVDPGCSSSGECGPNDIVSEFDVVTGKFGYNGHGIPDVNKGALTVITSGFDVLNASSVAKPVNDAGKLKTIYSGFNVTTGEMTSAIKCVDKVPLQGSAFSYGEDYHVVHNVSPMTKKVGCGQTVTYVTSTDFTHIEDLPALIDRWRAPISIALYASGTDFTPTIDSIRYLKNCTSPLISQFVSFHIYWHKNHPPQEARQVMKSLSQSYICPDVPPWHGISHEQTYRGLNGLFDRSSDAKNIAKLAAVTHYIMVADYGFYPNENLASEFIQMVTWNAQLELTQPNPKAFVLMDFVIGPGVPPPTDKANLVDLLSVGSAYPTFPNRPCTGLSVSPDPDWQKRPQTAFLEVSAPLKRNGTLQSWNPVFIGTANDPDFDKRVSLSGESTRGWLLCALDYDFLILNNAFVARHPNVLNPNQLIFDRMAVDFRVMQNAILPEYQQKYGRDKGCVME